MGQTWNETAPNLAHNTCQYCGAPARAWRGEIVWCGGERCSVLHQGATWEARLWLPPSEPPLWHRTWALLAYAFFRTLATAVPIAWILQHYAGTAKQSLAVWVHGNEYFWWERFKGRL